MAHSTLLEDRKSCQVGTRFAVTAARTLAAWACLLGCGGLAVDGRRISEDGDVRAEALPERFASCDALLAYTRAQASGLIAAAPTGNPFAPLFEPGAGAGFEAPAYAEWPEAAREGGAGRLAHARRVRSSVDDYFMIANGDLFSLTVSPQSGGGTSFTMPPALVAARGQGRPAWVFASGGDVLVVGEVEALPGSAVASAAARPGTFFWQLELNGRAGLQSQTLNYVDARLIGARRAGETIQVALLAGAPDGIGASSLPPDVRSDATRLARVRADNRDAIGASSANDWLPNWLRADAESGEVDELGPAALSCEDIYAPATPSGLGLLSFVDLRLGEDLASWQTSGFYTGSVQLFTSESAWAVVTEPWWSLSEDAARVQADGSPETILHTFEVRSRKLAALGSIAVRGAPQHDPVVAGDGEQWFLALHAAYGPARGASDAGRIWSFQRMPDALDLLGKSDSFELSAELRTDFVPGAAYVHARSGVSVAQPSVLIDLARPEKLELLPGPSGDFRVVPWSEGQHLRLDSAQVHLLSGTRELEQYPQTAPPIFPSYADFTQGWLVDVEEERSWRKTLRFSRFAAGQQPQVAGSMRMRNGSVLPPLIAGGAIVNGSFEYRPERASTSFSMELWDAVTFRLGAGASGG